jgi:hypothetical protein
MISPADTVRRAALNIFPNAVNMRSSKPIRIAGGDISEIKIVAQDGKVMDYWSETKEGRGGKSAFIKKYDGTIEWYPTMRGKHPVPGICFISASSTNPDTNKKYTQRRKIMLLP